MQQIYFIFKDIFYSVLFDRRNKVTRRATQLKCPNFLCKIGEFLFLSRIFVFGARATAQCVVRDYCKIFEICYQMLLAL